MLNVLPLLLFVVAAAFAAGVTGSLAGPLGLFLGLGLAGLGVLTGVSGREGGFRPLRLAAAAVVLACGVALLGVWPHGRVGRLFALAVLLAGADLAFGAFGRVRRELLPASASCLLTAVVFLVLEYSPPAWLLWRDASVALSGLAGRWVGGPLSLGPSYSGFDTTVVPLVAVLVVFVLTDCRRWHRLGLALVYLAAIVSAYLFTMTRLPGYDEVGHLPLLVRHVPWNAPLALLLLELPALWMVGERVKLRAVGVLPAGVREWLWTSATTAALLAGVAAFVVRAPEVPVIPARVVLYEKGYLNWSSPDFTSFGQYSSGMLGRLPVFLEQLGFEVVRSSVLDNDVLTGARVAVIFNPYERLPDDQQAAVWDFVRRGGSLLVVGEHTWLNDRDEETLNPLMSPSDIRFNFDSATYQIGGWLYGYGFAADGVYHRMRTDMNQAGVGIGASLEVKRDAVPLLFGTHGYSDAGIRRRRPGLEFMGDGRYVPGEQLGDVVLAAEEHVGAGRVVAVGDTTGFFNLLMMGSHEGVARLFGKLASPVVPRHHLLRLTAGLVLILGALVLAGLRTRGAVVTVVVAGLLAAAGVEWGASRESAAVSLVPKGDIAYVDSSHVPNFSRESWREDGLAGLYLNLMRNDVQPLRLEVLKADRLLGARMLFIIAPTRRYGSDEVDLIERFVRGGGYVVVCAGADSADVVAPLLLRFGLRVRNRPLGPFMTHCAAAGGMVRFHVGYAVEDSGGTPNGVLAWYAPGEVAVMMERLQPSGASPTRGGLLLIGDGHFLTNKNLEPEKTPPIMENVNFLKWLVGHVRSLEATGGGS